jgi:hypothetical protein
MGPALPAGIREALEPIRSSGWGILEDGRDIWAYLYRAVDSAGETIEFMLSPKRGLIAAKLFLRLALSGGGPRPRVINVDGHPAYASAVAELKQTGELSRCCRCRTAPYLNNIIEQDHRFIKKRITASLGFRSVEGACRTIEGYEAPALVVVTSRAVSASDQLAGAHRVSISLHDAHRFARFFGFRLHSATCSRSSRAPNFLLQNGHGRKTRGRPPERPATRL